MNIMVGTRDGLHAIAPQRQTIFEGHESVVSRGTGRMLWAVTDGDTIWRGADRLGSGREDRRVRRARASCRRRSAARGDVGRTVMRLDGSDLVALAGLRPGRGT